MASNPTPLPIEIVIIVNRLPGAISYDSLSSFNQYWNNLDPSERDDTWQFGPYANLIVDNTSPRDLNRQLIDSVVSQFSEYYTQFRNLISGISSLQTIFGGLGEQITGNQLLSKLDGMRAYITGRTYGNGYAGANYGDRFDIDFRELAHYMMYGQEGINYLLLHKVSHNTQTGLLTRSWMVNSYQDTIANNTASGAYAKGNEFFEGQEAYTNTIAKNIADAIGISISPLNVYSNWPPFGYRPL
ncbi:hypothetical protein C8J45_102387 [Sphingomonas sp. PP-CE-3G-477]|uniref:hypothetical protein n=1 Tax=Sphingomonas sp. PP-CE-3G-477 TaxID=2135660 RepID=UPI000D4A022B|nr:hypothetical protein [Sphingomonas sp. PP-CE-3G-477]PTQ65029.1 hypothetical protein C8J45_102387 [Sphingomonas sp. PP-CE-3G-477]